MIVLVGSLILLGVWTVVTLRSLEALRREQEAASLHWIDQWRIPRNRRALMLYSLWLAILGYTVSSLQFIDISFIDVARGSGIAIRVSLLILGVALLWRD